jgi:hypothetical protein
VSRETEGVHRRLGGVAVVGDVVQGDGVHVERPRCECDVLHRSENGLGKQKDGLVRAVGMRDLRRVSVDSSQRDGYAPARPAPRYTRPKSGLHPSVHRLLQISLRDTEGRQTQTPKYTSPRGCRCKAPNILQRRAKTASCKRGGRAFERLSHRGQRHRSKLTYGYESVGNTN